MILSLCCHIPNDPWRIYFRKNGFRREGDAAYYLNGTLRVEELTQAQVDAACRLHTQHLPGWQPSDFALNRLNELTPRFSPEVCLLKSATINAVYGTQVLAIMQMAARVTDVLQKADLDRAGTELVEMIADLRLSREKKHRRRTSFASKFCHFFVDSERFPIYDEAVRDALKLHLGRKRAHDDAHPYVAFCQNFSRLKAEAAIAASTRELDRYLWLTGMFLRWRKKPRLVNEEVRLLFETPSLAAKVELKRMLLRSLMTSFDRYR